MEHKDVCKVKVGDRLRIIREDSGLTVGQIYTVTINDGTFVPFRILLKNGEGWWASASQVEKVEERDGWNTP